MARSHGGVDGTTFWLAGAVRVLQKEVRELGELLADSYLGSNQDELGEVRPPKRAKYTVEQIVDMPGPQHHEDSA